MKEPYSSALLEFGYADPLEQRERFPGPAPSYELVSLVRRAPDDSGGAWTVLAEALRPGRAISVVYDRDQTTAALRCRLVLESRKSVEVDADDVHARIVSFDAEFNVLRNAAADCCNLIKVDAAGESKRPSASLQVGFGPSITAGSFTRRAGFHSAVPGPVPSVVLRPGLRTTLQGSIERLIGIVANHAGLQLTIQTESLSLTKSQLDVIRAVLKNPTGVSGAPFERLQEIDLREQLEGWLSCPTGIRYTAAIAGDPESEPSLAGIQRLLSFDEAAQLTALDLSASLCDGGPVDLLPSELLDRHGVRSVVPGRVFLGSGDVALGQHMSSTDSKVTLGLDDRYRHTYILGSSGTGKSSLLTRMIAEDMQAGRAVVLLDPHGGLAESVLELVPVDRADDVVVLDIGDTTKSAGLNMLECDPSDSAQKDLICAELLGIFGQLYDMRAVAGPMFENYLRHAVLLATSRSDRPATFMDIIWLFQNAAYRRRLLDACADTQVVDFWIREAAKVSGEAALENMTPYICSKLNRFAANATIRRLFGQPRTSISFDNVLNSRGILVVNLGAAAFGLEETRFVGMLFLGQLLAAAFRRRTIDAAHRLPVCVYIDEAQYFASETLTTVMAESRKYGLLMTLAHQNAAQLLSARNGEELAETVLANSGSLMMFRTGLHDAIRMERLMAPEFSARDLQSLRNFEVAARLLVRGQPTAPFSFCTDPAPKGAALAVGRIRERQKEYIRAVSDIDEELAAMHAEARDEVRKPTAGSI